ncbi:MAG: hypothetical protein R3A47_12090 [Polyangiales bacterium]
MEPFEELESEVRSYCRSFPEIFSRAKGSWLDRRRGRRVHRFFRGRGRHELRPQQRAPQSGVVGIHQKDGITHSLDMATEAKAEFLNTMND